MSVETLLTLVKANNVAGLKRELSLGSYTQEDLHRLLFQACYEDRQPIVDMLVDHPCYTTGVLAKIVVDALDCMQAEFASCLLGHQAFRERAIDAALHEAAGRKDEGDLEALITALINAGAGTGSCNEAGCTALEIARSAGYVGDKLVALLQPEVKPPMSGSSMSLKYAPLSLALLPEVMSLCLDNISVSDRKTIGAASGACQGFYLFLMDKRKNAQLLHWAENLDAIPLSRRADRFHQLLRSLGQVSTSSASTQDSKSKVLILCNLIRQIKNLSNKVDMEAAYQATLKTCTAMPQQNSLLPELARTLDCLPSFMRETEVKVLLDEARRLNYPDDAMQLLSLKCRAVRVCCMPNMTDLAPRFEALACDCIALPGTMRLEMALDMTRMIAANEDEVAQFKGWVPLATVVESLVAMDKTRALLDFASHFSDFPEVEFPWGGIIRWFLKQAATLDQPDDYRVSYALCRGISLVNAMVRSDLFENLAIHARHFPPAERTTLLCELPIYMGCIPNSHKTRENWFKWMVAESATLLPEHQRQLLIGLCCRLDELDHEPRVVAYLLIVSKMAGLPPPEQYNLMNGRGLLGKIRYLAKDARLGVFKSLAAIVGTMPDFYRKPLVQHMTGDECLRLMPASPERDKICAALADTVKSV